MNTRLQIALTFMLLGWLALGISALSFLEIGASEKVAPSVVQGLSDAPAQLVLQCLYFLGGFTLLHWMTGWLLAWFAKPLAQRLTATDKDANQLIWLVALIFLFTVIMANQYRFPATTMAFSISPMLERYQQPLLFALGTGLLVWLLIGLILKLLFVLRLAIRHSKIAVPMLLASVLLLITLTTAHLISTAAPFPADPERPHIVIVGIDSWRLSALPSHGGEPGLMPFVENFLTQSVIFEEAITPLARSYPSWWSILDGRYPHEHGIRFNLSSSKPANEQLRLPLAFRSLGYQTIFAMDERRFAPISIADGFDQVVGPATGTGDFLLGTLNDTPLTNFVINSKLGQWLFPFSHANRAIATTYQPETFDRRLAEALANAPRQPLFLTVHYELPHWPYTWADGPVGRYRDHEGGLSYSHYLETLHRVDQQIERLFGQLKSLDILNHGLVIMLADHGEAFHFDPSARQELVTPQLEEGPNHGPESSSSSTLVYGGHGTHIFSLTQHQVPLAFRDMRSPLGHPGLRPGRASLVDIAPTLLSILGQPANGYSGLDLLPYLQDPSHRVPDRMIPLETGFTPPSLISGDPDQSRLVAEAAAFYRIAPDGRLEFKPEVQQQMLEQKQIGLMYGEWIFGHLSSDHRRLQLYHQSSGTIISLDEARRQHPSFDAHLSSACGFIETERERSLSQCSGINKLNPFPSR